MSTTARYEYMNEESINEHLKCPICDKPFIDPVSTNCETKSHTFCRNCIEKWIKTKHSCPSCCQKLHIQDLTPVSAVNFIDMLNDTLVKCLDCKQTRLKRIDFDAHYNEKCPKSNIKCPSSDYMCPWTGTRDQLEEHLKNCNFDLIGPFIIRYQTFNQQRTQTETLTNDNKKFRDRENKQRTQIFGPMKADKPLSDMVNHQQTQVAGPIEVDKQLNKKEILQLFEPIMSKLSQQQTQIEVVTKDNKQLNDKINQLEIQTATLELENQQLKDQLGQQPKNQMEKLQNQQKDSYKYGKQDNSHNGHTPTGSYANINHAPIYPDLNTAHNYPSRDDHFPNSSDDDDVYDYIKKISSSDIKKNPSGDVTRNAFDRPSILPLIIPIPILIPISVNTNIANGNNNIASSSNTNTAGVSNSNNADRSNNNITGGGHNNVAGGNKNNVAGGNNNPGGSDNNIAGGRNNRINSGINIAAGINNLPANNNAGAGNNNVAGGHGNNIAGGNNNAGASNNSIAGGNNNFAGNNNNDHNGLGNATNVNDLEDHTNDSVTIPADDGYSDTSSIDHQTGYNPDIVHPPNVNIGLNY